MMKLTFHPDPSMRWIYDPSHPDYNTDHANSLRNSRERALAMCPAWMKHEAELNDAAVPQEASHD